MNEMSKRMAIIFYENKNAKKRQWIKLNLYYD